MGTTKSRKSRRNNSRPTAFTFLSNITLGNENDDKPPDEPSIRKSSLYSPNQVHLFNNSFGGLYLIEYIMCFFANDMNRCFFAFNRQ